MSYLFYFVILNLDFMFKFRSLFSSDLVNF